MKVAEHFYSSVSRFSLEGASLALFPLPAMFFYRAEAIGEDWRFFLALLASCASLICGLSLHKRPLLGKFVGLFCCAASFFLICPYVLSDPFFTLLLVIMCIGIVFFSSRL